MNLNLAEMFSKAQLCLRREILIPEEDDTPLGDEQRKLVPLLVIKILELDALDLGPDVGGQVRHLGRRREERLLLLVSPGAGVVMRALHIADLIDIVEVEGPRGPVGVSVAEVDAGLLEPGGCHLGEPKGVLFGLDIVNDFGDDRGWSHVRGPLFVSSQDRQCVIFVIFVIQVQVGLCLSGSNTDTIWSTQATFILLLLAQKQ